MNQGLSIFLNISRWFAAFLVLVDHLRHMILVNIDDVEQKTFICKLLYFGTGLGHQAVIVFFVISGYLVGALTLKKWQKNGPNFKAYISARVSRIYTALIPALIVGFILDFTGLHWFNASELYTNREQYRINSLITDISAHLDFTTFAGNLFMMQRVVVEHLGSNGPLWSLANEWWYYCIFAFIGIAMTSVGNKKTVFLAAAILLASLLPFKMVAWGLIWSLGFVVHAWINSQVWRPHPLVGVSFFFTTMVASRYINIGDGIANEFISDLLVGVGYVAALVSVSNMTMLPLKRFNAFLADFSYSTYLTHFPAMLLLTAIGYQVFGLKFQVQPSAYGWLYISGLIMLLYVYCLGFSLLTERHTSFVRNKLDSYLGLAPRRAATNKFPATVSK